MKVILDTNVFVSALLIELSPAGRLVAQWRRGRFTLVSSKLQIDELIRVTRYPKLRTRIQPAVAGRLVNEVRHLALCIDTLKPVDVSNDPYDNFLLSLARGGKVDFLVTGDKNHLLSLIKYEGTSIVSVAEFMQILEPG